MRSHRAQLAPVMVAKSGQLRISMRIPSSRESISCDFWASWNSQMISGKAHFKTNDNYEHYFSIFFRAENGRERGGQCPRPLKATVLSGKCSRFCRGLGLCFRVAIGCLELCSGLCFHVDLDGVSHSLITSRPIGLTYMSRRWTPLDTKV